MLASLSDCVPAYDRAVSIPHPAPLTTILVLPGNILTFLWDEPPEPSTWSSSHGNQHHLLGMCDHPPCVRESAVFCVKLYLRGYSFCLTP